MSSFSRRDFLKATAAAGAAATLGNVSLSAETRRATDLVPLGKSGVKVGRLAFGTGSMSGAVQRELGQEGFNRLVRHAYDNGIRFFETADSYHDMHTMLGIALKGIPRDTYQLMTKVTTFDGTDPHQRIDELRKQINSDYFEVMLLHWQRGTEWPHETTGWQNAIEKAQDRKIVLARGASVHGLPALQQVPTFNWLQVAMIRCNHNGTRMDTPIADGPGRGNVPEVVERIHAARAAGQGVISMKLVGEGAFGKEDRQKAMRFAFQNAKVDAVTVGYKNTQEIDEAIE
ncbi:MAG TPA: aldo/keto reductase, partial [Acidobacteriaceae bacterium]|nr:aldo/keto reductase [Acidobacteriaceae bacterium]